MYKSIYNKDCTNTMKLQDKQKNDEFLTGISGTFHSVGNNSYFVNSLCVWAENHVISTGKSYALFDYPAGNGIHGSPVKLMDVFMKDNVILASEISEAQYRELLTNPYVDKMDVLPLKRYADEGIKYTSVNAIVNI